MTPEISVVIPVYNNEKNLPHTYTEIKKVLDLQAVPYELIFIDDGSRDQSYAELVKLSLVDENVRIVKLARNFGQHSAIIAGLKYVSGKCAIVTSADLQDDPKIIIGLYDKFLQGSKMVIAERVDRDDDLITKMFAQLFNFLIRKIALRNLPKNSFDYFLIDKSIISILTQMKEKNSSVVAQLLWCGFNFESVPYIRKLREIGKSQWTFAKKLKISIDAILGFSYLPIRLISLVGVISCILSIICIVYLIIQRVYFGGVLAGWSSIIIAILFTSGVQMVTLGIIGEYLWRNFDETRDRPLYIVETTHRML